MIFVMMIILSVLSLAATEAPMNPGARYLKKPAACEYLGVGARTLDRLIESGELRAFRLGSTRTVRLDILDLDRLAQEIS